MSNVLTSKRSTVVDTAVNILETTGNKPTGPEAIVDLAIKRGLVRVPARRSKAYVTQIFQSTLYGNAVYSKKPVIKRTSRGKYKTTTKRKARKSSR